MDVTELLIADHNRVRGLVARYRLAAKADEAHEGFALADQIIHELVVHMATEEAVFYQSVHDLTDEVSGDVDEGVEEHHVAKVLIDEIGSLTPGSDAWVAKMTVLIESVEHHVDEEEDELFPSVRSSTSPDWRDQLARELEAAKVRQGATPLARKKELTKTELRALASVQKIPGRSSMDHDDLAASIDL
jgi:hemerythrin superfamily protein